MCKNKVKVNHSFRMQKKNRKLKHRKLNDGNVKTAVNVAYTEIA